MNCRLCYIDRPESEFSNWGRKRLECRECVSRRNREYGQANKTRRNERLREWRRANPEAAKAKDLRARLKRKYQLRPDEVDAMAEAQGGACILCDATNRGLVVDHCHETGRVRGLLCRSCNTIAGQVELAPVILDRIRKYLSHDGSSEFAIANKTSA